MAQFLNALSKGQDAIVAAKGDASNVIQNFIQLSDAATEVFVDFKDILKEVKIAEKANGEEDEVADLLAQVSKLSELMELLKRANQAAQASDYGKLLPIALELFQLIDHKEYNEIKTKFDDIRSQLVTELKKIDTNALKGLTDYLENANNFSFSETKDLNTYIQGIKAQVAKFLDDNLRRKTATKVYQLVSTELGKLRLQIPEELIKITMFIVDVSQAKSADEIQGILDAAILPVGSYRMKRQPYSRAIYLQGFAGFTGGYESLNANGVNQNYDGFFGGLFLPVGFEYAAANQNCGLKNESCGYNGIFISIIDVGAIGSFSLNENSEQLSIPALTFQNVLSPGLFYTNGLRNAPITWGLGARFAPELRQISVDANGPMATLNGKPLNSVQFNAFLAVDIPLARIFKTSK